MATEGKSSVTSAQSLENALGTAALNTLAKMTPAEFLANLKRHGINSLEDLANHSLATARAATEAGRFVVDPEEFGVCYKFSTARPHFAQDTIKEVVNLVQPALVR